MRKLYLLLLAVGYAAEGYAQYQLSGTNYVQQFDSLQWGLPAGWSVDSDAKDTALGVPAMLNETPSTATRWNNAGGGFKNVASANGYSSYKSATPALQLSDTDRALGVRQTGGFGDPGAAFAFVIDHTFGLSAFELGFKLQSLDSNSGRSTEWLVQYAIDDSPVVFITQAVYKTGGFTFENNEVLISFGALLDNQAERVWIRIVALAASTGGGSRTTTAIDDFELRWKGEASPGYRPLAQRLFPVNGATNVSPGSVLSVKFSRYISLGSAGSVRIKNETDNTMQIIPAGSASLSVSGKSLLIAGVLLEHEKTYHVTFDSSIVDTAGAATYALEDTSKWRFATVPVLGAPLPEPGSPRFRVVDAGQGRASLLLEAVLPGTYKVHIVRASGQLVCVKSISVVASAQQFALDNLELPAGWYVAMVYSTQVQLVQQFMMLR